MIEWAKDNDQDIYIENLPPALVLACFVSTGKLQSSVTVTSALSVVPAHGTYTIPAIFGPDGVEISPARPGVVCYRAMFEGNDITAYNVVDTPLFVIVREGQNVRVFAELVIRESRAGAGS